MPNRQSGIQDSKTAKRLKNKDLDIMGTEMIAAEDIRMDEFSKTGEEKAKYYGPKTVAEGKRSQQCKDGKALGQGSPEKENLKRKNSKLHLHLPSTF